MDSDTETIFALTPSEKNINPKSSLRRHAPVRVPNPIRLDSVSQPEATTKRTRPHLLKPKVPRQCDPDEEYEWYWSIDFCNGRSYCFAFSHEEKESFMILRVAEKAIFVLERPEPYELNLVDALAWDNSIFLVYRRAGVSLSRIHWKPCSALRDFKIICKEVRGPKAKEIVLCKNRRYVVSTH